MISNQFHFVAAEANDPNTCSFSKEKKIQIKVNKAAEIGGQ